MSKRVAVKVEAKASTKKHPADLYKTGYWKIASTATLPTPGVESERGPLLHSATAKFVYVLGSNASGLLPLIWSTIELTAKNSSCTVEGQPFLLENDEFEDQLTGNKLLVSECSSKIELK